MLYRLNHPTTQAWFNQNWIVALATISAGLIGAYVLLRQLKSLNQKNEFDLLQFVAERMRHRHGEDDTPHTPQIGYWPALKDKILNVRPKDSVHRRPTPQLRRFYTLKNRFRKVVSELTISTQERRTARDFVSALIPRIQVVRDLSEEERSSDLATLSPFINAVNDVAEMVEEGMVDVGVFLGKYHLSLIRETYIAEPYIYYYNLYEHSGRWAMRILRVGEMARSFNDMSPIHRRPVYFTDDVDFGCIFGAPGGRWLFLTRIVWFVRIRLSWYPSFTGRSKRRQNGLMEKVRQQVLDSTSEGKSL